MSEFYKPGGNKEKGSSYRGENFRITLDMQAELARRFYGLPKDTKKNELSDVVLRWVDQNNSSNSKNFRDFVEANPEIIELFKRDSEAALSRIENSIYEKQHS